MDRRQLLATVGAGLALGVAGCAETAPRSREPGQPVTDGGSVELPVPRGEIEHRLPADHIPAIVDPVFAAGWEDLTVPSDSTYDGGPLLPTDAPVVGVERDGLARAYPLRILDWHEVVNDALAGPLLVTYCPLCGSSVTAERRVAGSETVFGVSGRLWRDDLVLYDRATESWWSQLLATAIRGPQTGAQLSLLPSSLTTWGEWQDSHLEPRVLLPPPESDTLRGRDATFDYFDSKYGYDQDQLIGYAGDESERPAPRRLVIGVTADGVARAYPFDIVAEADAVNDTVGGLPVVVTVTPGDTLVAYERGVDGTRLTFEPAGAAHLRAGGSRWERATGRAIDGPYQGRRLASATDVPAMFWKGWRDFHPDTTVYGAD
jgi:hypothetical protein